MFVCFGVVVGLFGWLVGLVLVWFVVAVVVVLAGGCSQ